jgi:hypothetical protein
MYFKIFIFLTIFNAADSSVFLSRFFSAPKKDSIEEIKNGHAFECPKSKSHGVFKKGYFYPLKTEQLNTDQVFSFQDFRSVFKIIGKMYFKIFIFLTIFNAADSSVFISGFFSAPKKDSIEEIKNGHAFECPKSKSHEVFKKGYFYPLKTEQLNTDQVFSFQDFRSVFKIIGKYIFQNIHLPYHIQCGRFVCFHFRIFQCARKRFHRGNPKWTCI